jgi:hypothetical protein
LRIRVDAAAVNPTDLRVGEDVMAIVVPPDQAPLHSAVCDFPVGCVKGVFDVTT